MSLLDEVRDAKRLPLPAECRAIRLKAGVSQTRMAAELGVHRVTLAQWERGDRKPRGAMITKYRELVSALRELNVQALDSAALTITPDGRWAPTSSITFDARGSA